MLADYAPFVALSRLHLRLRDHLRSLQLHTLVNPGTPLLNLSEVLMRLEADKHLLSNFDVHAEFMREIELYQTALNSSMDEVPAQLNGKWLIRHLAPRLTGLSPERCRDQWCDAARGAGPHPDLRHLWSRLAG